ncbi:hypothetical protein KC887_09750 [Candidatus Kaiserbacteria bacterium]|nr:hypothetical protein [Candidatus Kaiserbacteria bacterium]
MGKRKGAGRKTLEETLGEEVVELTIRITISQSDFLDKQPVSKAEYIRDLIDEKRRLIAADMPD